MDKIIEIENLSKDFKVYESPTDRLREALGFKPKRKCKEFKALDNISFSLEQGKTLGIIGENGAGKSTLLKVLTGVLEPTEGTVFIKGKVSALLELGTGFNLEYTGIENIYLSASINGLKKEEADRKLEEILKFADIGDFVYQKVKTYSSGMFARLAFSVAVHIEPEILIVDEALSVGDIFFQQKCNQYMKEKMGACTKLLVTHDMSTIANMADEVIVLEKGKIVFRGEPLKAIEFYTKKAHTELYKSESKVFDKVKKEEIISDEKWNEINKDNIGGASQIVIDKFLIYVNEEEYCGYVKENDLIDIRFVILSDIDSSNLIFGYQIKDKYGNVVFGENTYGQFNNINLKKQKKYLISLKFIWPQVQENNYFLTLGIGQGTDEMQHTIQCWAHNIFQFSSLANVPNHGIFNNKIKQFDIEEIKH